MKFHYELLHGDVGNWRKILKNYHVITLIDTEYWHKNINSKMGLNFIHLFYFAPDEDWESLW